MPRVPSIAFMTTIHVNVGDEFIREGIFSFIDEIFEEWSPLYVNKMDLKTLHLRLEGESVSLNDKFRDSDVIIQAGAPVYWRIGASTSYNAEWAEELWEKRIFQLGPEKPILNIAAGACQPFPDFAKTFLSDPDCVRFARKIDLACRWTSVRDPLASQILFALGIDHDVLHCPAFHAARRVRQRISRGSVVGVNLMPLGGHWKLRDDIDQTAWEKKIAVFLPELRKRHSLLFIAHDLDEKEFMSRYLDSGESIFYSPDYRDYLPVYGACLAVIANRVHGAVCAAGFGCPSLILGNDTRLLIGDYIGLPSYYINEISPERIVEVFESVVSSRKAEEDRLLDLRERTAHLYREAILENLSGLCGEKTQQEPFPKKSTVRLASVEELSSRPFRNFMTTLNSFAARLRLRQFTDGSKIWEYPWLWFNGLSGIDWSRTKVLDIDSELGPMPWFLASLGASVTLTQMQAAWVPDWERIVLQTGLTVDWRAISSEELPFRNQSFDVVTSFSVIEHQKDKKRTVNEATRVLKPGGLLALSFDVCEMAMGTTLPEGNGKALTVSEFEELLWQHPDFVQERDKPEWNIEDIEAFKKWPLESAPHHNYVSGAAVLRKKDFFTSDMNPKRILLPRFDTLGDIILLEGFIRALISRFPGAEITLLVRKGYDELASLFPENLNWTITTLNPYRDLREEDLAEVSAFLDDLSKGRWDLLLVTSYNRTWLDDAVAARLSEAHRVVLGEERLNEWVKRLFVKLGLETETLYDNQVSIDEFLHETEKYQRLWDHLFGKQKKLPLPLLTVSEELEQSAQTVLAGLELREKEFFVCVPAGTQNVPHKAWPVDRFAEIIIWVTREYNLKPLIVGHEGEQNVIEDLRRRVADKGIKASSWKGKDGDIPLLAALTKKARFYFGNDTGPMHIASAVGIPLVGLFGGGTWPRFVPHGQHSLALVEELPCFGCGWECIFGDAPCMNTIAVEDARTAVKKCLQNEAVQSNILRSSKQIPQETAQYIQKAVHKFKSVQSTWAHKLEACEVDRASRLEVIERQARESGERIAELEADRASRLEVIERQAREFEERMSEVEADRAARLEVINKQGQLIGGLEGQIRELKTELGMLRSSRSWRMTAPFRWVHQKWNSFFKGSSHDR